MSNSATRSKSPKSTSLNKLPTSSKPKMTGTKQKVASTAASKGPKIDPSKEKKKKNVQPSFNSCIKVAVRLRPKSIKEEAEKEEPVIVVDENNIKLSTSIGETHFFTCDRCFSSDSISAVAQNKHQQQKEVYEYLAKPLLSQAFQGFNTCLFAYGQTGTGKSYSMMGKIGSKSELADSSGIIPRFCQDFFIHIDDLVKNYAETSVSLSIEIQISYFEIYKEQIQDLLCSSGGNLSVREHPKNGPYVVNLTKCQVTSFEEVQRWLAVGNRKRVVASTSQNKRSSRSHVIFTIMLSQSFQEIIDGLPHVVQKQSRINFIDLAGSERLASTSSTGVRREESLAINLSLFTLGKVITALAEKNFAPYRESVLTWLLKESLGGNSKTAMLATVSPRADHVESTLSTLRYSCLASKIVNTARICEDPKHCSNDLPSVRSSIVATHNMDQSPSRVQELESEARYLKTLLTEVECKKDAAWKEKVAQAELRRAEAEEALANIGLSTVSDPQQPYLVNVNQDPLLSQTMFFPLYPGQNWVGPIVCSNESPAIQLAGMTIEINHCCIEYSTDLKIFANAETYVNGQLVGQSEVLLRHGDRIVIGGSHFFHLHNPKDSQFNEKNANNEIVDFETSYHELREVQEKTLEAAVKEAQEKARLQMLSEIKELRQEAASEISSRRQFYENEIASIAQGLQARHCGPQNISPPLPSITQSNNWKEIELLLQDTQRQLEQPPNNCQKESAFVIQSMLNEANAICRRFNQPYIFSRKEAINEELNSAVCVQDQDRGLVMYWNFDQMRQRLKTLRLAAEESANFPTEAIFYTGDVWYRENDASSFFAPNTRAKLQELLKTLNDSSTISSDGRKFSPESPRRSSLFPRSPTNFNAEVGAACRKFIQELSISGCLISTFCVMASSIQFLLDHPDRSATFAIGLTVKSTSFLAIYQGLVDFMFTKREVLSSLRNGWLKTTSESRKRLQNSLEFVIQGVALDSPGLFMEWILLSKNAFNGILAVYCELSVVFCTEATYFEFFPPITALTGFTSVHKKVHESVIVLAEEIRLKIEQLPEHTSPNPSLTNNGCSVTNACYNSIHHVIGLLEELRPATEDARSSASGDVQLGDLHLKFRQRVDLLLRMGKTIDHLFGHLKNQVLSQVTVCAATLNSMAIEYSNLMGVSSESPFLCELSYYSLTVHRCVGETKRKAMLQKGRDIHYSPVPAQMLVTPPPKTNSETRNV